MTQENAPGRLSHRIILRDAIVVGVGDDKALLLELGTGGAKIEHRTKLNVGTRTTLRLPEMTVDTIVRYLVMLPSTSGGVIYHVGLEFADVDQRQSEAVNALILEEAEQQVLEWESNFEGRQPQRPALRPHSEALHHFVWVRLTPAGWTRMITKDPNQPLDGFSVPDDTPEEEIEMLCATYEKGDPDGREYLRRCARLAILERLRAEPFVR